MIKMKKILAALVFGAAALPAAAFADTVSVSIQGTDAIFLAGRTDIAIPAANLPWAGGMIRHGGNTPEELAGQGLETFPTGVAVAGGDVIKVGDPAVGGINFFNGFGPPYFGPDGNGLSGSNLTSFGGISGYKGPQGPLVGVFLDDNIPNGAAPATLDFSPSGLGTDFTTLSPLLGQVFYIGDGVTSGNVFQEFMAPAGATRLFLGIADGFGFVGAPGAYDDNDGAYRVSIGINEDPIIPLPMAAWIGLTGAAMVVVRKRRATIE